MVEQYWYGVEGMRVKKTRGGATTYTFFAQYEEEVTNGVTTVVSYYTFGGLRIAVKRGSTLYHLHGDHLGSTSLTTLSSATTASRAYGAERSATGDLQTDRTFTGQKRDATGLMYYNARYYDPALGTFVSPDSMVPNPASVIDHNRFLYARGNPLKYTDPTGHEGYDPVGREWVQEFYDIHHVYPTEQDRQDRIVSLATSGYVSGSPSWNEHDWKYYTYFKVNVIAKALGEAGISIHKDWNLSNPEEANKLIPLAEGIVEFGYWLGQLSNVGVKAGLAHLKTLTDDGFLLSQKIPWSQERYCPLACASETEILINDGLYGEYDASAIRGVMIHETAHVIFKNCKTSPINCFALKFHATRYYASSALPKGPYLSVNAAQNPEEYWAEAVAISVYGAYHKDARPDIEEKDYFSKVERWVEGTLKP